MAGAIKLIWESLAVPLCTCGNSEGGISRASLVYFYCRIPPAQQVSVDKQKRRLLIAHLL